MVALALRVDNCLAPKFVSYVLFQLVKDEVSTLTCPLSISIIVSESSGWVIVVFEIDLVCCARQI